MVTNTTRLPAGWTTVNNKSAAIPPPSSAPIVNHKLDRRLRPRDRELAAAGAVIARMRRHKFALHYLGSGGWLLGDGTAVKSDIAGIIVTDSGIYSENDTLFPGVTFAQTYRAILR
jgi:hypothetical protein